jgi:hypothetical protein
MSDANPESSKSVMDAQLVELRRRADGLEKQLSELHRETQARLIMSELKAEALRAGIIDLDGLRLADTSGVKVEQDGGVSGAVAAITELRCSKPWLFSAASSSSTATVPSAQQPAQKTALQMSEQEYRAARAALLRRRV